MAWFRVEGIFSLGFRLLRLRAHATVVDIVVIRVKHGKRNHGSQWQLGSDIKSAHSKTEVQQQ